MASFRTLDDLRKGEEGDKKENEYYVGGASKAGGSGLAVQGNPDDIRQRLVQQAQKSQESADGPSIAKIIMYKNGFVVNDGPLRGYDDQENAKFLEELDQGYIPSELANMEEGGHRDSVRAELVDKRGEDYVAPPEPSYIAFSGEGRTMSLPSEFDDSFPSQPGCSPPEIDESQPTTRIQIRLANGKRHVATLNLFHTIADIRRFIDSTDPTDSAYQLISGFPPTPLRDLGITIEAAGLQGASISQKIT